MNQPLNELRSTPATEQEYIEWTKTYDGVSPIPDSIHAYVLEYFREKNRQMEALIKSLDDHEGS